jgi:arginine:agmatine antiporter
MCANPSHTIPVATMLGIFVATALYILGTTVVMGVVPHAQLVNSVAPFADAARIMWGPSAALIVSLAVIVSSLGALNGWTLLMGQVPMAAANDDLFPEAFGRVSSRGVPARAILLSTGLATALVIVVVLGPPGFTTIYKEIVNLATMTAVVPYAFCALAVGLVTTAEGRRPRVTAIEVVAFIFAIGTIYGCGPKAVLYGLLLLLGGIPVYVWQRRRHLNLAPVDLPASEEKRRVA